jgi:hypothetical protein
VTTVGRSDIAGQGLFSDRDAPAGAIFELFDEVPGTVAEFGRVNHSCDPNLGWYGEDQVARRDIAAGEELTIDYATAVDDPAWVLYCHCGSTRCRQAVEGTDWQIPALQDRYAGQWAPVVAARIASRA